MDFKLKKEFIELDNLLKASGMAGNGAEARIFIDNGDVFVNGEAESRIRRKLKVGDVVSVGGKEIRVV